MTLPAIDQPYLINFLTGLLNTPSPTGFTEQGIECTQTALAVFPELSLSLTRKGALLVEIPGQRSDAPRALTAHVDTLGAMVKEIKSNGRLKITRIGGLVLDAVETEGCMVFTSEGKKIRGSLMVNPASSHVYGKMTTEVDRNEDNMEVRLDECTTNAEETHDLGIEVGDFIAFDPRVEVNNGFVRSRFLDDKACVAVLVAAVQALHNAGLKPLQTTYILFSNYEEVGHGAAAGIPAEVTELLAVDMAAVGEGQTSDEYHASICVKDSGGPYHHEMCTRLRKLADQSEIPYKVDIYPYYGSDGEAFWHAGADVRVALIGPGVDASHNYERTHLDALMATTQWVLAYLLN
ncbi:MAG: M42 family metallopeptidase [Anaerolineaceae bacterium]